MVVKRMRQSDFQRTNQTKVSFVILATFSWLSVYTSKFLTWQFFLVKEKLARQIFLDKENLSTIPHLHEQFFFVKAKLSRKNCSCKSGFIQWAMETFVWLVNRYFSTQISCPSHNWKSHRQTWLDFLLNRKCLASALFYNGEKRSGRRCFESGKPFLFLHFKSCGREKRALRTQIIKLCFVTNALIVL